MIKIKVDIQFLEGLEPLASLSTTRIEEMSELCYAERVAAGRDPFEIRGPFGQSVYLVVGELELKYQDGTSEVARGGSDAARHPIGKKNSIASARALTEVELIRIEDDLLDVIVTWDQLAAYRSAAHKAGDKAGDKSGEWMLHSSMFNATSIKYGAFSQLPPANIDALIKRLERMRAAKGDVIVKEGDVGDYYYLIESGSAAVTRLVGGVKVTLAELGSGDAFGEEALVSGATRNATVTMTSDGALLRLSKRDFNALLREPLLNKLSFEQAGEKVAKGGAWLDVRYTPEYQYDKLPGAINMPLDEIRHAIGVLGRDREYVVYCQSGRRSAAAAFLLAQQGYKVHVLDGGLWTVRGRRSGQ